MSTLTRSCNTITYAVKCTYVLALDASVDKRVSICDHAHTHITHIRGGHIATPKVRLTVEVTPEVAQELEALQQERGWTRAEFIQAAIVALRGRSKRASHKG